MDVKSQLKQAQFEHITDAQEAATGKEAGRGYYNTDQKELIVTDGAAIRRIQAGRTTAIGDVKTSFLTEAEYQVEIDVTWILADGRSIIGSDLHVLNAAYSNAPDLRGVFIRGKNNGRSDGNENPDGDSALAAYQADELGSHKHSIPAFNSGAGGGNAAASSSNSGSFPDTDLTGGNETRARNVTVNYFIKINR